MVLWPFIYWHTLYLSFDIYIWWCMLFFIYLSMCCFFSLFIHMFLYVCNLYFYFTLRCLNDFFFLDLMNLYFFIHMFLYVCNLYFFFKLSVLKRQVLKICHAMNTLLANFSIVCVRVRFVLYSNKWLWV